MSMTNQRITYATPNAQAATPNKANRINLALDKSELRVDLTPKFHLIIAHVAAHPSVCCAHACYNYYCVRRKRRNSDSLSVLKQRLWKAFALEVQTRDNWTCVTCGRQQRGPGMGAGHGIARGACGNEYYFSERNVHAQCTRCKASGLYGNRPGHPSFYITDVWDSSMVLDLETNYHKPSKWTAEDFKAKIAEYEDKTNDRNHAGLANRHHHENHCHQ